MLHCLGRLSPSVLAQPWCCARLPLSAMLFALTVASALSGAHEHLRPRGRAPFKGAYLDDVTVA
eukprot:11711070-Alexandrium_andersonii.AAC.1